MRTLDNLKISIKILLIICLMSATTIFVTLMLSQRLMQADHSYSEMLSKDVANHVDALSMRVMLNQMLYMDYKVLNYDGASQEAKASA